MVLAAERPADFGQRCVGELLDQVHGDLPGIHHLLGVALLFKLRLLDLEAFSDGLLDGIDGHPAILHVNQVLEDLLGHLEVDRRPGEG